MILASSVQNFTDKVLKSILKKLRVYTDDGLTRAALILFGKDPGAYYPNAYVKIGRFGDNDVDLRFQEVCEGSLIRILYDVMEQLEKKFLTKPVRFEGIHRIEELEYPVAALREMLLNALVHRNYLGSMIQMKVYDGRLTLWNAGTLPAELTIEQLFQTHESIPRNPLIAEVCYKAGYIDSWGRGVEKISSACKEAGLPGPRFMERSGGMLVELNRTPVKSSGKGSVESSVKSSVKIVQLLKINPEMTIPELAEKVKLSTRAVEKNLKTLQEKNQLRRVGSKKAGHWEVIDD